MKKRITSFVLCLIFIFCFTTPVMAAVPEEESVSPAASYLLGDYLAFIDDLGGGKINVVYSITAKYAIDKLGATQIEVQYKLNGSWYPAAVAYSTVNNQLVQENTAGFINYYSFDQLDTNMEHRAVLRFYAKNGSIEESRIYTTSSVVLAP